MTLSDQISSLALDSLGGSFRQISVHFESPSTGRRGWALQPAPTAKKRYKAHLRPSHLLLPRSRGLCPTPPLLRIHSSGWPRLHGPMKTSNITRQLTDCIGVGQRPGSPSPSPGAVQNQPVGLPDPVLSS